MGGGGWSKNKGGHVKICAWCARSQLLVLLAVLLVSGGTPHLSFVSWFQVGRVHGSRTHVHIWPASLVKTRDKSRSSQCREVHGFCEAHDEQTG